MLPHRWRASTRESCWRCAPAGIRPPLERFAIVLGRTGNNGGIWFGLGLLLAIARLRQSRSVADLRRRRPGRDRPQLSRQGGGPPAAPRPRRAAAAGRGPQLAQLPLGARDLIVRGCDRDDAGRAGCGPGVPPRHRPLARPPLPRHALPLRCPRRRPPRHRPRPPRPPLDMTGTHQAGPEEAAGTKRRLLIRVRRATPGRVSESQSISVSSGSSGSGGGGVL